MFPQGPFLIYRRFRSLQPSWIVSSSACLHSVAVVNMEAAFCCINLNTTVPELAVKINQRYGSQTGRHYLMHQYCRLPKGIRRVWIETAIKLNSPNQILKQGLECIGKLVNVIFCIGFCIKFFRRCRPRNIPAFTGYSFSFSCIVFCTICF